MHEEYNPLQKWRASDHLELSSIITGNTDTAH